MKESKAMMKKEVAFMKKKGAPKSMVKHEEKEMKGYKGGGGIGRGLGRDYGIQAKPQSPQAPIRPPLPGEGKLLRARSGGMMKGYKEGGSVGGSYRRAADGIASKGKTKGKAIAMRMGGKC